MSQGLTPWCARSTMRWRTTSGSGLPFTKAPPSWFSPPWPERTETGSGVGPGGQPGSLCPPGSLLSYTQVLWAYYVPGSVEGNKADVTLLSPHGVY